MQNISEGFLCRQPSHFIVMARACAHGMARTCYVYELMRSRLPKNYGWKLRKKSNSPFKIQWVIVCVLCVCCAERKSLGMYFEGNKQKCDLLRQTKSNYPDSNRQEIMS